MTITAKRSSLQRIYSPREERQAADLLWDAPTTGVPHSILRGRGLIGPLEEFLSRPGKSLRGRLVEQCWRLCSPDEPMPADLSLLVEWVHAGSLIVDDIQDDSHQRRQAAALHVRFGVPKALNAGNALYFGALALLSKLDLDPIAELELHRRFADAMLRSHQGQALDLEMCVHEIKQQEIAALVALITDLKTAPLFELSAMIGPIAGDADPRWIHALSEFGRELGVALQMLNDLEDLTGAKEPQKRCEDLRNGRLTWTWAWLAERATRSEFASILALTNSSRDVGDGWETVATTILRQVGDFGRQTASLRLHRALAALAHALGPNADLSELRSEAERLEKCHVDSL